MHPSCGGVAQPRCQSRGASRRGGLPPGPAVRWRGAFTVVLRPSKVSSCTTLFGLKGVMSHRHLRYQGSRMSATENHFSLLLHLAPRILLVVLAVGTISSKTQSSAEKRWKLFYWGRSRTDERARESAGKTISGRKGEFFFLPGDACHASLSKRVVA